MKQYIILGFVLILLLATPTFVSAEEEVTIFDLNYLTKVHVTDITRIYFSGCGERLDYVSVQKGAYDLNFTTFSGDPIDYSRYSIDEEDKFNERISSCMQGSLGNYGKQPDEMFDIVIFNFSSEHVSKDSILVKGEYDLPLITDSLITLRNSFYLANGGIRRIRIILPENNKLWYRSIPHEIIDENNNKIILTWQESVANELFITYGSTSEYLIYEGRKESYISGFMNLFGLLLGIVLTFGIYFKENKKPKFIGYSYLIFFVILSLYYVYIMLTVNIKIIVHPFIDELGRMLFVRYILMIFTMVILYYATGKLHKITRKLNKIKKSIKKHFFL